MRIGICRVCVCVCVVWGRVLQKLWMSPSTGLQPALVERQTAGRVAADGSAHHQFPLPPSDALPSSETETVSNGRGHAVQASRSAGDLQTAASRLVSSGRLGSQGPGMALALGRGAELGVIAMCLCEARARPLAARCRTGNSASVATADGPRQPAPVRGARQIPQDPQLLPTTYK